MWAIAIEVADVASDFGQDVNLGACAWSKRLAVAVSLVFTLGESK